VDANVIMNAGLTNNDGRLSLTPCFSGVLVRDERRKTVLTVFYVTERPWK
jgi:hypothetical protein